MIYRENDNSITFACYRPSARSVHVAGDFNAWNSSALPLHRDDDGWWRGCLHLPAGEYRFRYLVDNQLWEADFAAYGVELKPDGHWNSVLWIAPADLPATRAA